MQKQKTIKAKIIIKKEIINNSYSSWKNNRMGWCSTFVKYINQKMIINEEKDNIENMIVRNMKIHIDKWIKSMINDEIEKVIELCKIENKNDNDSQIYIKKIYGILYKYIDKEIKNKIGNANNYKIFKFKEKPELITQIKKIINNHIKVKEETKKLKIINEILPKFKYAQIKSLKLSNC